MMLRGSVVALVVLVATSTGCSLAGRTFGTYVDDQSVTAAVKMGLARKVPRTVTRVDVDTFQGTVYLSGEVGSAIQKSDAEITAWQVNGVTQVVNDLTVRGERATAAVAASASPSMRAGSPLLERIPGIARVDPPLADGGSLAYDGAGAIVATVYRRPSKDVAQNGFEAAGPMVRPIDHVSVYGVPAEAGLPEAQMYIVFWHVSAAAAAALR
jgi:hyperosmotically inducible periplasmic protein